MIGVVTNEIVRFDLEVGAEREGGGEFGAREDEGADVAP